MEETRYKYEKANDLLHAPGPTYSIDPDNRPLWWLRNLANGGGFMHLKTAIRQQQEFQRAISYFVRANGGIPDNQVTSVWKK